MRRILLLFVITAGLLAAVPARPVGTAPRRAPLSSDLELLKAAAPHQRARVIVHGDPAHVRAIAARAGVRVIRALEHESVVEASAAQLELLASDPGVQHLSGDVPVRSAMAVSNRSTAADQAWEGSPGLLGIGGISGVNGKGIGIALLDSGISNHKALSNRVVAEVSFVTGDPTKNDTFGHGTHIAGLIAGNASAAKNVTDEYSGGVAPGAHLIDVRVLGANGTGYTSDVIAGIDWVIANRSLYNIRIINLSLGHAVMEPVATDPLCEAVERAVRAGIVVIASAGNRGKTDDGRTILGGITSPGNSPYAITVGALNTWKTVARSDDSVTTYSSRGPTRYDLAVKPDVVAPGNKVTSSAAAGSYLAKTYPATHVAGSGSNAYMRLSGTSMATGVVSGGVALLLQGSPKLTPSQVKILVQAGATFMPSDGLIASGAGSVNFWTSRRAAVNGLDDLLSYVPLIGGVVSPPGGAFFWDAGSMMRRLYAGSGVNLIGVFDLADALLYPHRLAWDTLHLAGGSNPIGRDEPNHIIWGDVSTWTTADHIIWGDSITDPQGQHIIWGDTQMTEGYHIIWGDAVLTGDAQ